MRNVVVKIGFVSIAAVVLVACSADERHVAASPSPIVVPPAASASSYEAAATPTASSQPSSAPQKKIVELPDVDTSSLVTSEKVYFSEIVADAPSPCGDASTIETCVLEHRACALCVPAARDVARFVLQGEYKGDIKRWLDQRFGDAAVVAAVPLDKHPTLGRKDAPIELVEFADFECPHCGLAAPKLHALVEKDASLANKVRLVFGNMPLSGHAHAEPAARAAWAAHLQGKFWAMHDQLFAHQDALEDADLERYAKAAGCDLGKWRKAFEDPATKQRVADDYALATKLGVEGTPSFFVNRRRFVSLGTDEFDVQLRRWLDEEALAGK